LAAPPIELERFLPYRLSVLANLTSSTIAGAYERRFDLSIPEWRVIAVLSRYPGLSAREVAQKSRMDAVAVSRAVNRLLRAGRLRRTVDASDRRRSVLHVSRSGAAVYRQVAPLALRIEKALLAPFTPADRALLDRVLGQLQLRAEALADEMRSARPPATAPGPRAAARRRGSPA
jgi:DNA-binding MarR family transcriptional regulator